MFGSLQVTGPEGADLTLEGSSLGPAPVSIDFLRTGIYSLSAEKSGYHARTDTIRIDPSEKLTIELAMDRKRDKKWWLYRVGPLVLASVAAAIAISAGSGDETPAEEPLAGPPPPP